MGFCGDAERFLGLLDERAGSHGRTGGQGASAELHFKTGDVN